MPSKTKNAAVAAPSVALPNIPEALLEQFVTGAVPMTPDRINHATTTLKAPNERAPVGKLAHYSGGSARGDAARGRRQPARQRRQDGEC